MTGSGLRLLSGELSFSTSATALDSFGIWLRNSEVDEDVLHVGREPIRIVHEVRPELWLLRLRPEVAEREFRGVVERSVRQRVEPPEHGIGRITSRYVPRT